MKLNLHFTLIALLAFGSLEASPGDKIELPSDFRRWTHVKTQLIGPRSQFFASNGGIHHVYANERALDGFTMGTFAEGAVLVFELLEAKETDGVTAEGARIRVDVMVKDSAKFGGTGGWGFERFMGDGRSGVLDDDARGRCYACHKTRSASGSVFSILRK